MAQNSHATDLHSGGSMLAESDNVSVFLCSCGNMHLQIGAVCLTMHPDELSEVGTVVLRALAQLPARGHASLAAVN